MVTPMPTCAEAVVGSAEQAARTRPATAVLRVELRCACKVDLHSYMTLRCAKEKTGLLPEQGLDERHDVPRDDLVALGGGVGVVALHESGDAVDVFEEKRQQRDVVLLREQCVGGVELLDVVGPIVGREGDARERYLDIGGLERGDDLVEAGAAVFDAKAAESVVTAEFDDDCGGMEGENAGKAGDAILGGVAGDAEVNDAVVQPAAVEIGLEEVRVGLAGIGAVAGGERVAEADENGAMVIRVGGFGRRSGFGGVVDG